MVYVIKGDFLRIESDTDSYSIKVVGRTDDSIKKKLNHWFDSATSDRIFSILQSKIPEGVI